MPSPSKGAALDSTIKSWLSAMNKAKKIKPGGKLVFVNKKSGSALPLPQAETDGTIGNV